MDEKERLAAAGADIMHFASTSKAGPCAALGKEPAAGRAVGLARGHKAEGKLVTGYLRIGAAALSLGLASCGSGGSGSDGAGNASGGEAANRTASADKPQLPPCPFRETQGWKGSNEGGRLLVTGTVDVQMAGMKPVLSPHAGAAPGVAAFDLALVPEANAAVSDLARYEQSGAPRSSAGEIWCGGERIARFDMINL